MKVYFSLGKESGPWGSKIKALAAVAEDLGQEVESIDYSDLADPDQRVLRLLDRLKGEHNQVVLVGSSMGGYVSTVASMGHRLKACFCSRLLFSCRDTNTSNTRFRGFLSR